MNLLNVLNTSTTDHAITIFFIGSYVLGLIIIFLNLLFTTIRYNQTGSDKYNFLAYFPFELNPFKRFQKNSYYYPILQGIGTLILLGSLTSFLFIKINKTPIYFIVAFILLSLILYNVLSFVKLSNFKLHLGLTVAFAFSNLLVTVLEFLFLTNTKTIIFNNYILNTVLIMLILIFALVLLINPARKKWFKMVQVDAQTFARPRNNYLATLEWGNLLVLVLNFLPLIICLF